MPWGAVAGAVIGGVAASSSASKAAKGQKEAAEINKAPWSEQQPYILDAYKNAEGAFNNATAMGNYQGPYTAGMNPMQVQGLNSVGQFAQNQGMTGAQSLYDAGQANLGNVTQFGNNAGSLYAKAGQDPTQQIIGNAGQYAANPYMDSMIDAASRDVTRNLHEQQLPGLDMAAASTGNMNSSRTGVAEGIMQRGAADRIADISANLRGAAYNNGLGMAQNQYNNGMTQQMSANGQLLQAGNFGADAIGNGVSMGYGAGNAMNAAGGVFTAHDQQVIDGNRTQHQYEQNNGLDLVGKYLSSINGNFSGGGASYQAMPSTMDGAMSGALTGIGLAGKLNGMQQAPAPAAGMMGSGTYGIAGGGNSPAPTAYQAPAMQTSPYASSSYTGMGAGIGNFTGAGVPY